MKFFYHSTKKIALIVHLYFVAGVLAHQGGEDVEEVPVDKPLGPSGPGAAAEQGELGGAAGVTVPAQVLADALAKRQRHLDVTEIIIETWNVERDITITGKNSVRIN